MLISGCDCAEGDRTGAFGPDCGDDPVVDNVTATGTILVSDIANSSIRKFTGISTLDTAVVTNPAITGSLTQLTRPEYLTLHPTTGELIVPDAGTSAVFFFANPTDLEGNVPPTRILTGPATELTGPVQTYVDPDTDELYVLDKANSRILVYNDASTLEGPVAPTRRLGGSNSAMTVPNAFIFRKSTNQLSVLNGEEVLTFNDFSTMNGDPPPDGRFGGAATTFTNLTYGVISSEGTLIVADAGSDQLLTFENFQFDQNNQAPTRIVRGNNTRLSEPRQFFITSDTLYVADSANILVFDEFSTLEGNPFPSRRFSGLDPTTQTLQGLLFP